MYLAPEISKLHLLKKKTNKKNKKENMIFCCYATDYVLHMRKYKQPGYFVSHIDNFIEVDIS